MQDDDSSLDIQDLQRRARSVREFEHVTDAGATLRCRYPSRYDWVAFDARHRGDSAAFVRAVVEASVIGWRGVQVRHALADAKHGEQDLPFGEDTLGLVLDQQTGWLVALWQDIRSRKEARDEVIEASLKNSHPTSGASGSELPAAMH